MKKYVYLWGGSEYGMVAHLEEQNVDHESRLRDGARMAWEENHPGKFLQLVVSENHAHRMR